MPSLHLAEGSSNRVRFETLVAVLEVSLGPAPQSADQYRRVEDDAGVVRWARNEEKPETPTDCNSVRGPAIAPQQADAPIAGWLERRRSLAHRLRTAYTELDPHVRPDMSVGQLTGRVDEDHWPDWVGWYCSTWTGRMIWPNDFNCFNGLEVLVLAEGAASFFAEVCDGAPTAIPPTEGTSGSAQKTGASSRSRAGRRRSSWKNKVVHDVQVLLHDLDLLLQAPKGSLKPRREFWNELREHAKSVTGSVRYKPELDGPYEPSDNFDLNIGSSHVKWRAFCEFYTEMNQRRGFGATVWNPPTESEQTSNESDESEDP